jgi:hypothetical protein
MNEVVERLTAILHPDSAGRNISRRSIVAGVLVTAAGVAGELWYKQRKRAIAPLRLTCTLEAQRLNGGKPVGEPRATASSEIFEGAWRVRWRAQPAETGFFYLIDEGLDQSGTLQTVLLNNALEPLQAGQAFETKWYDLEGKPGTDRLGIVWSKEPMANLDSAPRLRELLTGLPAADPNRSSIELRGLAGVVGARIDLRHR